jgi:hypothetical protein
MVETEGFQFLNLIFMYWRIFAVVDCDPCYSAIVREKCLPICVRRLCPQPVNFSYSARIEKPVTIRGTADEKRYG